MIHLVVFGILLVVAVIAVTIDLRGAKKRAAALEAAIADQGLISSSVARAVKQALVVDGCETMRASLGRVLQEEGYQVAEASDGREALARLAELTSTVPAVLALVGSAMADMTGLEFVEEARSNAGYHAVRIVVITPSTDVERLSAVVEPGAADLLTKPFSTEALVSMLRCETE